MARNKFIKRVAGLIVRGDCGNGTREDLQVILGGLDAILLDMLEPMERRAFDWIVERKLSVTSGDLSQELGIQQNHASMILSELCELWLLDRRKEHHKNGNFYIYTLHGDYEQVSK